MTLLIWIVFGAVVGWIVTILMDTNGKYGLFETISLGIAGALVGGVLSRFVGSGASDAFSSNSLLLSLIGSIVLTFVIRKVTD